MQFDFTLNLFDFFIYLLILCSLFVARNQTKKQKKVNLKNHSKIINSHKQKVK